MYDAHVWKVYGYFAYRLRSRDDAEDLTQQTFERALKAWHRYDPKQSSPGTWLLVIARNLLVDRYRAERAGAPAPLDELDAEPHAPLAATPQYDLGLDPELERAIAALSDRERELIALRYGGDLTGPEIAALVGLTLANVQQILSRALRRMRTQIEASRAAG